MRRFIFVVESDVSERDQVRFGFRQIAGAGFHVEAWNVGPLLHSERRRERSYLHSDLRELHLWEDLESGVRELTPDDVVLLLVGVYEGADSGALTVARGFLQSPAICASIAANAIPTPSDHLFLRLVLGSGSQWLRRLLGVVRQQPSRFARFLKRRPWVLKVMRFRPTRRQQSLDFVWLGGSECPVSLKFIGSPTRVRVLHSLDMDRLESPSPNFQTRRPVVFIDSMGPLHPDYRLLGIPTTIDSEAYFELICGALDRVEKIVGAPILIAAHARAERGALDACYDGRPVVYGSTARAIADSDWVITASGTTAIGWAVALAKPVSMIVSRRFEWDARRRSAEMVKSLRLGTIDADSPDCGFEKPVVRQRNYSRYQRRFLGRTDLSPSSFWSLVVADIERAL